jgi:hypothetical protein
LIGGVTLLGYRVAPAGAFAFPDSPTGAGLNTSFHNSVMMSSLVRELPSRTRTRPDNATNAASNDTVGSFTVDARTDAKDAATAVMSIAPRTDEPTRKSV